MKWPRNPRIYEINTVVWLSALAGKYGRHMDLGTVPREEWNLLAGLGMDAVWFMGVWRRSPVSRMKALESEDLLDEMRAVLGDLVPEDVIGSPYCVQDYEVDERVGGRGALETARRELAKRGMLLVLDFVPNHTAIDHPWVVSRPDLYISGSRKDLADAPGIFVELPHGIFALGKDPYFPSWTDVLQLNAFNRALRDLEVQTLLRIAGMCDGVRCDMAMLVMNDVFERTWGEYAGPPPPVDFWEEVIPSVKKDYPDLLFMAEVYWDLEWPLMQQGFDCCYDKRLYDRLLGGNAQTVRLHLNADPSYQERLVRFLENHDEQRCAKVFPQGRLQAASVAVATLPGVRLFYEGQIEGRSVRVSVQLARGPKEEVNGPLRDFYLRLLGSTRTPVNGRGVWRPCEVEGWPDNQTCANIVAWDWVLDGERLLVALNLSDRQAQGMVRPNGLVAMGGVLRFVDLMSGAVFVHRDLDVAAGGLYVDLGPWGHHVMGVEPAPM
jgi:hypothetical protein